MLDSSTRNHNKLSTIDVLHDVRLRSGGTRADKFKGYMVTAEDWREKLINLPRNEQKKRLLDLCLSAILQQHMDSNPNRGYASIIKLIDSLLASIKADETGEEISNIDITINVLPTTNR